MAPLAPPMHLGLVCLALLVAATLQASAMQAAGSRAHITTQQACSPESASYECALDDVDQWRSGTGLQQQDTAAAEAAADWAVPEESAKNLEVLLLRAQLLREAGNPSDRLSAASAAAHVMRQQTGAVDSTAGVAAAAAAVAAAAGPSGGDAKHSMAAAEDGAQLDSGSLARSYEYSDYVESALEEVLTADQVWQHMQEGARSSSWEVTWETDGSGDDSSSDDGSGGYDAEELLTADQLWARMQADGWGSSQEIIAGSTGSGGSSKESGDSSGGSATDAAAAMLLGAYSDYSAEVEEMRQAAAAAAAWHLSQQARAAAAAAGSVPSLSIQGAESQGASAAAAAAGYDAAAQEYDYSTLAAEADVRPDWYDDASREHDYSTSGDDRLEEEREYDYGMLAAEELPIEGEDGLLRLIDEGALDLEYEAESEYDSTGEETDQEYYYSEWQYEDGLVDAEEQAASWDGDGTANQLSAGSGGGGSGGSGESSGSSWRSQADLEEELLEAYYEDFAPGDEAQATAWVDLDAVVDPGGVELGSSAALQAGPGGRVNSSISSSSSSTNSADVVEVVPEAFSAAADMDSVVEAAGDGGAAAQRMWDAEPRSSDDLHKSRRLKAGM